MTKRINTSMLALALVMSAPACGEGDEPGGLPMIEADGCGDGKVSGNEQCDDGNNIQYDGCFACELDSRETVTLPARALGLVAGEGRSFVPLQDGSIAVLDDKEEQLTTYKPDNAAAGVLHLASDGAGGVVAAASFNDDAVNFRGHFVQWWTKDGASKSIVSDKWQGRGEPWPMASADEGLFGVAFASSGTDHGTLDIQIATYDADERSVSDVSVTADFGGQVWFDLEVSRIEARPSAQDTQLVVSGYDDGDRRLPRSGFIAIRGADRSVTAFSCGRTAGYLLGDHLVAAVGTQAIAIDDKGCEGLSRQAVVPGLVLYAQDWTPLAHAGGVLTVDNSELSLDADNKPQLEGTWGVPAKTDLVVPLANGDLLAFVSEDGLVGEILTVRREDNFGKADELPAPIGNAQPCEFHFQCESDFCDVNTCRATKRDSGAVCTADVQCASASCADNMCK